MEAGPGREGRIGVPGTHHVEESVITTRQGGIGHNGLWFRPCGERREVKEIEETAYAPVLGLTRPQNKTCVNLRPGMVLRMCV